MQLDTLPVSDTMLRQCERTFCGVFYVQCKRHVHWSTGIFADRAPTWTCAAKRAFI